MRCFFGLRCAAVRTGAGGASLAFVLADGALALAHDRWLHVFVDPRSGESIGWTPGTHVVAMQPSGDRRAVLCATREGRTYRLALDGTVSEVPEHDRIQPRVDFRREHDATARARRSGLFGEYDRWLASSDDGRTVVYERCGYVMLAEAEERQSRP